MLSKQILYSRKASLLRLARKMGGEAWLLRLARAFYHLRLDGLDHLPQQGGCLIPFNHVALYVDALVYLVIRSRRPDVHLFTWRLAQGEVTGLLEAAFGTPAQGPALLFAHKRQGQSAADLLRARQVLLQGGAVALAPEGEPSWDGRLQHPLAPGAAWLALRTACLVAPVVSLGGYDIQPVWQVEKIRLTGRVTIRGGQPFRLCAAPLDAVAPAQLGDASQRIWQALAALLA